MQLPRFLLVTTYKYRYMSCQRLCSLESAAVHGVHETLRAQTVVYSIAWVSIRVVTMSIAAAFRRARHSHTAVWRGLRQPKLDCTAVRHNATIRAHTRQALAATTRLHHLDESL